MTLRRDCGGYRVTRADIRGGATDTAVPEAWDAEETPSTDDAGVVEDPMWQALGFSHVVGGAERKRPSADALFTDSKEFSDMVDRASGVVDRESEHPPEMIAEFDLTTDGLATTVNDMERSAQRLGRALVVVVDDRVAHGEQENNIGALVTELLEEAGFIVDGAVAVAGETVDIRNALNTAVIGGVDVVITVGGTGVSPRDVTPDATAGVLDQPIPGIAEALRGSGLAAGAVDAGISRGLVGVSGSTLVVNLAGSRAAVRDGMATLTPLVTHVIEQLSGLETA